MVSALMAPVAAQSQSVTPTTSVLKAIFKALDAESCPRRYNFHLHTTYSDGQLTPEQVMEQAVTLGLRGLAITDHHSASGYQVAQHWLEDWKLQHPDQEDQVPQLWTGVEINAGLLDVEVHILGYGFDPSHPRIQPYLQRQILRGSDHYQAKQVIRAIQGAGGLAVLAHPARYRRPASLLIPAAAAFGVDGVETYYAYTNPKPWQPSLQQTAEVKQLAQQYYLLSTCGTDTHGLSILERL